MTIILLVPFRSANGMDWKGMNRGYRLTRVTLVASLT
jgi:hypothetical protein